MNRAAAIVVVLMLSINIIKQAHASEIYIESDPFPFMLKGYSIGLKRSATFSDRTTIGLGYYAMTLPQSIIDSVPGAKGKNWQAKVDYGLDIYLDYHFFEPDKGMFTGLILSNSHLALSRNDDSASYNSFTATWRVGTVWRPISNGFYLMPWVGISYTRKLSGVNTIQDEVFEFAPLGPFGGVYFGYSFD